MPKGNRTAFITGAGKNIGRACALDLASRGFNVVINGRADKAACDAVVGVHLKGHWNMSHHAIKYMRQA